MIPGDQRGSWTPGCPVFIILTLTTQLPYLKSPSRGSGLPGLCLLYSFLPSLTFN